MPFFGFFRSKEEKLVEAIMELHARMIAATLNSAEGTETVLKEQMDLTLDSQARYDLLCEFYCFYIHILDRFALRAGCRTAIETTLWVGLGIFQLVEASGQSVGRKIGESRMNDLLEQYKVREFEYRKLGPLFVADMSGVLHIGVTDVFFNEHEAKASRLMENIVETLQEHLPELAQKPEFVQQGADPFGTDLKATSLLFLCTAIQNSVYKELEEADLTEFLSKIRPLIR